MRRVLLALPLAIALLWTAAAASAGPSGGLDFVECLTGKRPVVNEPRTPREGGCVVTQTVAGDGEGSGINDVQSLVASPDGRSLYGVTPSDNAVAVLDARPLRLRECFTTNVELRDRGPQPCHLLPHPGTEDVVSGFDEISFVTVSPDGRSVYTVSRGEAIGMFARAPSGKLTYKGCITGSDGKFSPARNGSCKAIPSATDDGIFSGLGDPTSLTVSPDGRFVYVTLAGENGIATLARAPNGSLSFVSCLQGRPSRYFSGSGMTSPCPLVSTATKNPNGSGLAAPKRIAISADGTSLYSSSPRRGAIAEFRRDPASGALSFSGCLGASTKGTGPGDPCRYVPQAEELAWETGLWGISEIALNPAGTALYGVAGDDDSIVSFTRDPATGTLTFAERAELPKPYGLALSKDGSSLFVASRAAAAVTRFRLAGARMRFLGCLTWSPKAVGPCARARAKNGRVQQLGYTGINSLALAGTSLYAAAGYDSALSRLRVR